MDYVVRYSEENDYKSISLEVPSSSPDARHVYEKHGFVAEYKSSAHNDAWSGLTAMKRKNN